MILHNKVYVRIALCLLLYSQNKPSRRGTRTQNSPVSAENKFRENQFTMQA